MNERLMKELRDSLYVHRPLPLHREESLEARIIKKKVTADFPLYPSRDGVQPTAENDTNLHVNGNEMTFSAPLTSGHWPKGASPDGDYSNFGTALISFSFPPMDWRPYSRIVLEVRPRSTGQQVQHLNLSIVNAGETPLPDPYFREGATVFDLDRDVWQECIWEFDAMPRDAVTKLDLYVLTKMDSHYAGLIGACANAIRGYEKLQDRKD